MFTPRVTNPDYGVARFGRYFNEDVNRQVGGTVNQDFVPRLQFGRTSGVIKHIAERIAPGP